MRDFYSYREENRREFYLAFKMYTKNLMEFSNNLERSEFKLINRYRFSFLEEN